MSRPRLCAACKRERGGVFLTKPARRCSVCKVRDATSFVGVALDGEHAAGGVPIEIETCAGCFEEATLMLARWYVAIERANDDEARRLAASTVGRRS